MKFRKREITTPLGTLVAVADDKVLHQVAFEDDQEILPAVHGLTEPLESIEKELNLYFASKLKLFHTPLQFSGTPFQIRVWEELKKIPYGATCTYGELARAIGKPTAYRAAANSNGANRFVIVVPCHRVIQAGGKLGGYNAGCHRKQWLLNHEKKS